MITSTQSKHAIIYHSGYMGDGKKEWSVDVFDLEKLCAALAINPQDVLAGDYDMDDLSGAMFSQTVDAMERVFSPSQEESEAGAIAYAQERGYQVFSETF